MVQMAVRGGVPICTPNVSKQQKLMCHREARAAVSNVAISVYRQKRLVAEIATLTAFARNDNSG